MWVRRSNAKNTISGEGGGFPRVQAVMSQVSPGLHVVYSNIESVPNVN
jgi:hypothetical protein